MSIFDALGLAGIAVGLLLLAHDVGRSRARRAARSRHPVSRGRVPVCACDDPARPAWHTPTRCVPIVGCQCRGTLTEPGRHMPDLCQPIRESV